MIFIDFQSKYSRIGRIDLRFRPIQSLELFLNIWRAHATEKSQKKMLLTFWSKPQEDVEQEGWSLSMWRGKSSNQCLEQLLLLVPPVFAFFHQFLLVFLLFFQVVSDTVFFFTVSFKDRGHTHTKQKNKKKTFSKWIAIALLSDAAAYVLVLRPERIDHLNTPKWFKTTAQPTKVGHYISTLNSPIKRIQIQIHL